MLIFPEIESNQFNICFSELKSGIILNVEGNYFISDEKQVFFIFDDYELAKKKVSTTVSENPALEGAIFNFQKEILYLLNISNEIENKK